MAGKDVLIELPIDDPDGTIKLLTKAIARNTALGLASPVKDDFNWVDIASGLGNVVQLGKEAGKADRDSQDLHYKVLSILGSAKGQNLETPNTLHLPVTQIRNILLVKNPTNPEALSVWGFDVVVDSIGGKRTVRVDIPLDSPESFITLCKAIVEQHTTLGVASPLNGKINMTVFATNVTAADTAFSDAEDLRAEKESKHEEALMILGYADGQTIDTPETLYNFLGGLRDLLLVAYPGNPEKLTT